VKTPSCHGANIRFTRYSTESLRMISTDEPSVCPFVYISSLRPLAGWDCGFESRLVHGYLSLVSVVCCQLEVSASG
jgi:hypothetical protein